MRDSLISLPSEYVYALDIGTRNVVGVIATMQQGKLVLIDYCSKAHPQRAMYDGQIHEIDAVAKIVREVTDELEQRSGFKISNVSIAAAGRALVTKHVSISKVLDPNMEITKNFLDVLEISAIQEAQAKMEEDENASDSSMKQVKYFCIGYSVTKYFIDAVEIKNPIDHRGEEIKLELILTFLPQSVVDSLYKVIEKTGLFVKNITLEPIAAIKISIPDKFRLLNLALVDVGAGTSDIAITKDGTIFSYGMIDVAGDEITEAIVKEYLVDFDVAEHLKKEIANPQIEKHKYVDILGFEATVEKSVLIDKLSALLEEMAKKVADAIMEANADIAVSAVFLIGGGCQFPTFKELLAKYLSLPEQRVAIKDIGSYSEFVSGAEQISGPENVTPFGIALHSIQNEFNDFLQIQVNDMPIRLFNSKRMKVSDALAMAGFKPRQLIATKGEGLEFFVNNALIKIGGNHGEMAKIYVNGSTARLDTVIKNKDYIHVVPATAGKEIRLNYYDYLEPQKYVFLVDKPIFLKYNIMVNSTAYEKSKDDLIKNNDEISYDELKTLGDLLEYAGIREKVLVNKKEVETTYLLKHEDVISFAENGSDLSMGSESSTDGDSNKEDSIKEDSNKKDSIKADFVYEYDFVVNGKKVAVKNNKKSMIFVDIFNYIDFDVENTKGRVVIRLNGEPVRYTDEIKSGDSIEIICEDF